MKIIRRLQQIDAIAGIMPMIERADRQIAAARTRRSSNAAVGQLKASTTDVARRILHALASLNGTPQIPDATHIALIEQERLRLHQNVAPLDDGTLATAGPYDVGQTVADACAVSKPPRPAAFLYHLIRVFNPKSVIELGTNVGISSSFIGMALKDNAAGGRLVTLEASPYRLRQARVVHSNLMLDNIEYVNGLFAATLAPTLRKRGHVDFAFIDGHHQFQPTLDYFNEITAFAAPGTAIVFDDIRWSKGMRRAWRCLQRDDRLSLVADLTSVGICVLQGPQDGRRTVTSPLKAW